MGLAVIGPARCGVQSTISYSYMAVYIMAGWSLW